MEIRDIAGHGDENEMYAFISVDENGKSGICAVTTPLGITPTVGMTLKDMDKYRPFIEHVRKETGVTIKLIRYQVAEVIED